MMYAREECHDIVVAELRQSTHGDHMVELYVELHVLVAGVSLRKDMCKVQVGTSIGNTHLLHCREITVAAR